MPPFFESSQNKYGVLLPPARSPISLPQRHCDLKIFTYGKRHQKFLLFSVSSSCLIGLHQMLHGSSRKFVHERPKAPKVLQFEMFFPPKHLAELFSRCQKAPSEPEVLQG